MAVNLSGCGISQLGNLLESQGRGSGNTYTAQAPDTQTNSFFALTVHDAFIVGTLDGYYPEYVDRAFLVVDVSVENVLDSEQLMPMATTDFQLEWEGCSQPENPYAKFSGDQLEDEWEMAYGETVRGTLVFDCPVDQTEFSLVFQEYWDDDFVGDTYIMNFTADDSGYEYVAPEANGRSTGHSYILGMGDTAKTAFFEVRVDGVEKSSQIGGYETGIPGMDFVMVDITIRNTFGEDIEMFTSDFTLEWGSGEDEWDPGFVKSFEDQLEDQWTMADGEEVSGRLYFAAPSEKDRFRLVYTEVWADSFIGDTYLIELSEPQLGNA